MNKNILITGAAGFIGYHLAKALAIKGYRVLGIDNMNSYYDVNLKSDRLKQCGICIEGIKNNECVLSTRYPNYSFIKADICEKENMEFVFKENSFDYVIHLAAQVGVRDSEKKIYDYLHSNIIGFTNILESCRHNKIKHLIYASSSSVYGNNTKVPFAESDNVDFPVSFYAATKKSNELMAHVYSHLYKLPVTGLRFFTVYGPWGRPDMAPTLFAKAIKEQKPIKVFNNGNLERDFTYVDDIVDGIVRTMSCIPNENAERPFYQLLNIGNTKKIQLLDFIGIIEKSMGQTTEKLMLPMQKGDVKATWADVNKIYKLISYTPKTNIEQGIKEFVLWFNEYYKDKE